MDIKLKRSDYFIMILSITGLLLFIYLFPRLYPESAIRFDIQKSDILENGVSFVRSLGFEANESNCRIVLKCDSKHIEYLNKVYGTEETNHLVSDSIPVYYWDLEWPANNDSVDASHVRVEAGTDNGRSDEMIKEKMHLQVDLQGKPIMFKSAKGFARFDEDENVSSNFRFVEAEKIAEKVFNYYPGSWEYEEKRNKAGGYERNNLFKWNKKEKIADEHVSLHVGMRGEKLRDFFIEYNVPKPYSASTKYLPWAAILESIKYLIIIILIIVQFIIRLRSDMIDLKRGVLPGIILATFWGVVFCYINESGEIWQTVIGAILITPFIGVGLWMVYSVGLSISREVWPHKLNVIDSLKRKKLFPSLGSSIIRGIGMACIVCGLISVIEYVGVNYFHAYIFLRDGTMEEWSSFFPGLIPFIRKFVGPYYTTAILCLFFAPLLQRKFKKKIWVFLILPVIYGFFNSSFPPVMPYGYLFTVNVLTGIIFTFFILKYNFVTVVTGALAMPVLYYGIAMTTSGMMFYILHGIIILCFIAGALIYAAASIHSEAPSEEETKYVPPYLQRIYEKERIQRELEIARNIQISFLPRSKPTIPGVEIALFCLPATEVGGDYYDFIEIAPGKFGIVIGDVSGKGISAAFYMTLTKGFLKSQAKLNQSPVDSLININELFYENVERGVFISMIYSVFDLNKKKMFFARAGHNPMILRRSCKETAEEINTPGIALGLEKGDIFSRTIEEKSFPIQTGDVFFFYTDGLNEAQNLKREEFGEERLRLLVEKHCNLSAESLLDHIEEDIHFFTEGAPRHDDMTSLVIKIL